MCMYIIIVTITYYNLSTISMKHEDVSDAADSILNSI